MDLNRFLSNSTVYMNLSHVAVNVTFESKEFSSNFFVFFLSPEFFIKFCLEVDFYSS